MAIGACYSRAVLPTVVVDVVPPDAMVELTQRMVDACSQALAAGQCALASSVPESTRTESVAMILWQGPEWLRVNVRVGGGERKWVTRQLSFSNEDSLLDRWATVGLTIATLVDEIAPSDRAAAKLQATPPLAPQTTPQRAPAPSVTSERRGARSELPRWLASLSASGGTGWRTGGPRWGVSASGALRIAETPLVATMSLGYGASRGPRLELGNVHTDWYSVGLGGGGRGWISAVDLAYQAGLELLFQRAVASAGSTQGSDDEWQPRVCGAAAWPGSGPLAGLLTGALQLPLTSADSGAELAKHTLWFDLGVGVEARW